jgi:hypothetical protein
MLDTLKQAEATMTQMTDRVVEAQELNREQQNKLASQAAAVPEVR